jgi:hypothetical protein
MVSISTVMDVIRFTQWISRHDRDNPKHGICRCWLYNESSSMEYIFCCSF